MLLSPVGGQNLAVRGVGLSYGQNTRVLDSISFGVDDARIVAVMGPNGCGKTTLLRVIGGLISPERGSVTLEPSGQPPRRVGFVFQDVSASLFPWLSVLDNIALPLAVDGMGKQDRRAVASKLAGELCPNLPTQRFPYELSVGQQQLAAFLRAMIRQPELYLLDEPFSAFDFRNRQLMMREFLRIWRAQPRPTVVVTHTVDEAVFIADAVIVLGGTPAGVEGVVETQLPRPRTDQLLQSSAFAEARLEVMRLLGAEPA